MKEVKIHLCYSVCSFAELSVSDQKLISMAKESAQKSYAPYSKFHVGAALFLSNGSYIVGNNQENASYPNGICAERTALYQAGAIYPQQTIKAMAIAACNDKGVFTSSPCPPCGSCRQVMLESEVRQAATPIRLLLYGTDECYIIEGGASALLPLSFGCDVLTKQ
ncbi:MAG: cytidine deaminase [Bacteroidaceae bacterium]|nr:cytidine deaminase [Bacteroidaceae bacterium]